MHDDDDDGADFLQVEEMNRPRPLWTNPCLPRILSPVVVWWWLLSTKARG